MAPEGGDIGLQDTPLGSGAYLWPTRHQELLLSAATGKGQDAVDAFAAWRQSVDIEAEFDHGTFRLLPLVYDNLRRLGVRDPFMGRLKGVYRMSWYETHRLFDRARSLIAALEADGVRTLLLKGAPLVLSYYRNAAVRPMADIDVVVAPRQIARAIACVERLGLRRVQSFADDDLKYRHAVLFSNGEGLDVDLHWHFLYETCNDEADGFFWSEARSLDFAGVPTLQLDAAGMLVHTIVHGIRWNAEPPTRWIPDTLAILRQDLAPRDWERVVGFAASQKLTCRLALGLRYLVARHGAPVPPEVLARLEAAGVSLLERIENTVVLRDRERIYRNPIGKQWVIFADFCRWHAATGRGPIDFLVGLSHYVRYRWGLKGRMEVIPTILRGLGRRAGKGARS